MWVDVGRATNTHLCCGVEKHRFFCGPKAFLVVLRNTLGLAAVVRDVVAGVEGSQERQLQAVRRVLGPVAALVQRDMGQAPALVRHPPHSELELLVVQRAQLAAEVVLARCGLLLAPLQRARVAVQAAMAAMAMAAMANVYQPLVIPHGIQQRAAGWSPACTPFSPPALPMLATVCGADAPHGTARHS